jgi:hypothetical protein
MTAIKATVTQNGKTLAKVTPQQNVLVTNYQVSTSNISLNDMVDVEVGNLQDGALLSYDATTQTWKALSVIENPNTEVNGGFF